MNNTETLEQEAPAKKIKTPAKPKTPKTTNHTELSKNEIENLIEWVDLEAIKKQKIKEEPLHVIVYYKFVKQGKGLARHGRVTFSHFLSKKYNLHKKFKFGTLNGKVIFQATEKEDGLIAKIQSKSYPKLCVSNCNIAEIIYEKYGLGQSSNSVYFKLKDLGNDFYLIDEIIK